MKVINREKNSGKTKELINYSLENDIPILVLNDRKYQSLREKCIAYFGCLPKVVTAEEASTYQGPVLIDDADEILNGVIKNIVQNPQVNVVGMTLSA